MESRAGWSQERDEDAGGRGMLDEKNGKQLKGDGEMLEHGAGREKMCGQ